MRARGYHLGDRQDRPPVYRVPRGQALSFLGYGGFPASACISVNDEVIHGIPSKSGLLQKGRYRQHWISAPATKATTATTPGTFACGQISAEAQALLDATREEPVCRPSTAPQPGNRLGDIGHAVQAYVEARGYSVVREYRRPRSRSRSCMKTPSVPNYGTPGHGRAADARNGHRHRAHGEHGYARGGNPGRRLDQSLPGTASLSAHFEHTVAITADGPVTPHQPWMEVAHGAGNEARWQGPLPAMIKAAFSWCWQVAPALWRWWPTASAGPWNAPSGRNSRHLAPTGTVPPGRGPENQSQAYAAPCGPFKTPRRSEVRRFLLCQSRT